MEGLQSFLLKKVIILFSNAVSITVEEKGIIVENNNVVLFNFCQVFLDLATSAVTIYVYSYYYIRLLLHFSNLLVYLKIYVKMLIPLENHENLEKKILLKVNLIIYFIIFLILKFIFSLPCRVLPLRPETWED